MKKNEDGEVELVLGNGQLLGVFFIVVILLGLFFGMGYIMGRSSGPATGVEVATVHKPEVKPLVVESPVPKSESPSEPSPTGSGTAPPPPIEKEAEPAKTEKSAAAQGKAEPAPKAIPVDDVPNGTFLQLAAVAKPDAELEVEVLHKKNFKAILMEVPEKPGTFRVLVGPVGDGGTNKMREDLQNAGFPGKIAIVKKF